VVCVDVSRLAESRFCEWHTLIMEHDSRRSRIAIFFHDLGGGGAEHVMIQVARGFIDIGHPVDLVLARAEGPLLSEVHPKIRIVDFKTKSPAVMLMKLIKYLQAEKPVVLLSPFEVTSVVAIVAKKITNASTRVVVRISTNLSKNKRTRWKKIVERFVVSTMYLSANGIIAVSRGVAEDLVSYARIPFERITVVYSPIITDHLLKLAEAPIDHPFFADELRPVILGVGRLAEEKDFGTLIKAFDLLRKKIPARLIILGEGEQRPILEELIRAFDLQEWVDLAGFQLNPFAFMKNASVFVLSSKWEGLPGALIQALACGCPVISTNCLSGPSEILKDGQYGQLVPVGDVEAMALAIEEVLKGNIRKPPASWLEQYTINAVLPQYKAVFGI
jgi:glycosyltransferase involved in cell wall biosynthesis